MNNFTSNRSNYPISTENKETCFYFSGMFILLFLLILIPGIIAEPRNLCMPGNGTIWNGAFTPVPYHLHEMDVTNASISSYQNYTKKPLGIVAFSHEWSINRTFPIEQTDAIHASGAMPYIRLMLRTDNEQYHAEPIYTLKRIRDGIYDTEFRQFARVARNLSYPVLIEYGTEMNGWWFSWNGYWTGKEQGTELFQSVYRHIIDVMNEEGANNLFWIFHINWHSNPEEEWNTARAYYPGDQYIDIIGISAYGALSPNEKDSLPFTMMMDEGYLVAKNISPEKPVLVSEMGTDLYNPYNPAIQWTDEAFSSLISKKRWPDVIGFVWWNAAWPNDTNESNNTIMRIEENEEMQTIIQKYLVSGTVTENICK